jgi:hypothetical protein
MRGRGVCALCSASIPISFSRLLLSAFDMIAGQIGKIYAAPQVAKELFKKKKTCIVYVQVRL